MSTGAWWSPAERRYLIDSRARGATPTQQSVHLGRSVPAVHEQLKQLRAAGALAYRHRRAWSDEDDRRLVTLLDDGASIPVIARQISRTIGGTTDRINRRKLQPRQRQIAADGLGVNDAARELGTHKSSIMNYIRRGWILASQRVVRRQMIYTIEQTALRDFITQYGGYAILDPDEAWRPLVEEARRVFQARYITRIALIKLLYVCDNGIIRRQRERGFPVPALLLHQSYGGAHYERSAVWAWLVEHPEHMTKAAREELP